MVWKSFEKSRQKAFHCSRKTFLIFGYGKTRQLLLAKGTFFGTPNIGFTVNLYEEITQVVIKSVLLHVTVENLLLEFILALLSL